MSSACLRIHSQTLTIDAIAEYLNMRPSKSFAKGTLLSPRIPKGPRRESSLWILETASPSDNLQDHIAEIVGFIESRSAKMQELSRECVFDVFCELSSNVEMPTLLLKAEILRRLELVPVDLVIDVI